MHAATWLLLMPARAQELRIDPLLVLQAHEVWSVIAAVDNPVWPGWSAADTPLLFYLPGQQEVLINHPHPPAGFAPYHGTLALSGFTLLVKDGPTSITVDGQNTSRSINGIATLVVADTLSNRRNTVAGMLDDPRPAAAKVADLDLASLSSDPYGQLALIAHEAFHVFQQRTAPGKSVSEALILDYPILSVPNNVGFALEGRALGDALRAGDAAARRDAALRWLAVRRDRRRQLPPAAIQYEDGTEWNEGLAKYVEYRLSEVLEEREPDPALRWAQGFCGYDDLTFVRERLIADAERNLSGTVRVNNSLHDAGSLRLRLYYSGMAIGVLLDRLDASWTQRILEPGSTLTSLASEALAAPDAELTARLAALHAASEYRDLVAAKERLAQEGLAAVNDLVRGIVAGDTTAVTLDYADLGEPRVALAFTPFGVARVDADRVVYRHIPLKGEIGDGNIFEQSLALPLLHDRKAHRIQFRLPRRVLASEVAAAAGLERLPTSPIENVTLALPGVTLRLRHTELELVDDVLRARLLR
ncbi:MAG: hypothetical protein U1E76_07260 [Planctomycetota bacterium]